MLGRWLLIAPVIVLLAAGCSSSGQTRVVVAAGTTLVDSEFMAEIVDAYAEVEPSTELSVVGLSSAHAISLAEAGDADVIITHNREALDEFLEAHPHSVHFNVFASDFFLVADRDEYRRAESLGRVWYRPIWRAVVHPHRYGDGVDASGHRPTTWSHAC